MQCKSLLFLFNKSIFITVVAAERYLLVALLSVLQFSTFLKSSSTMECRDIVSGLKTIFGNSGGIGMNSLVLSSHRGYIRL